MGLPVRAYYPLHYISIYSADYLDMVAINVRCVDAAACPRACLVHIDAALWHGLLQKASRHASGYSCPNDGYTGGHATNEYG